MKMTNEQLKDRLMYRKLMLMTDSVKTDKKPIEENYIEKTINQS